MASDHSSENVSDKAMSGKRYSRMTNRPLRDLGLVLLDVVIFLDVAIY